MNAQEWFQAAEGGDIATIRSMIVEGFDISLRDDQGRTAFHVASQHGHTDIMTTILAAKKMDYLKSIGIDPYAVPSGDMQTANENRRSA
jgi:ankyrin repeat protein